MVEIGEKANLEGRVQKKVLEVMANLFLDGFAKFLAIQRKVLALFQGFLESVFHRLLGLLERIFEACVLPEAFCEGIPVSDEFRD